MDGGINRIEYSFREVTNSAEIYALINSVAKDMNDNRGLDHWIDYYTEELIAEKLKHGRFIGAYTDDNKLIGVVHISTECPSYYKLQEEDEVKTAKDYTQAFTEPNQPAFYISALGILPRVQGKGIAKRLLTEIEEIAANEGIRYCRLDARQTGYENLPEIYKHLGYEIKSEMPIEGIIYVLMEKDLWSNQP